VGKLGSTKKRSRDDRVNEYPIKMSHGEKGDREEEKKNRLREKAVLQTDSILSASVSHFD